MLQKDVSLRPEKLYKELQKLVVGVWLTKCSLLDPRFTLFATFLS